MRRKWKLISLARYSKDTLDFFYIFKYYMHSVYFRILKFPMEKVNKLFRSNDRGQEEKNLIVGKFIIK